MNQVEPKRHLFNHVFSQLSCEWEELQKENTTSCAQMKTLSGKLLKLLSSSDLYRRELLQKQENIKVLFQIVEVFCTKDQQITQNILESVYLACSPAGDMLLYVLYTLDSRVSCLAEVGLLSLLFNCLNKVAANVSILQNNILSIDTLALCHALIAKLALKEKKFATICRLSGALKSTILLLKLSTSDKMNLVSVDVLRLNATSSVNCTLMIKEGIVTILQSIILSCGHRKCQILKKSLDLLSTICKLENGVKKAIRTGLMKQLLNIYKSWHKWDLKNSHVAVRKSVLHSIIACLMFPIGSKAFIDEEGFKTIYLLGLEQLDRPDTDVLIKASILILRKCFVQKIPLRSLWSLYNFPLPQSSHFVETENFLPVLTVNGDEIEEENVYKDTHVNISIYDYMNFMPELKENKELHSQHNVHKQKYSGKDLDEEIKQEKSPFRHISSFLINPTFDYLSPNQPEPLLERKPYLLRYKIFEDFQRIIFPDTIINRTVFDLDELTHETYLSSNSADCENDSLKPDKYIGNLKPNLKTHSSLRSLSGPIQLEMIKKDPLIFESRFESGNLRKAIQVRSYEYDLLLNADINTSGHHQWFYFQISNMEPNVSYRFNIINCEKANSQFNFGMQPLLYSMRLSQRGQGWIRAGTNICYYKNFYVKDLSSHKHYHTATFTISFPHAKDTCYLAYHYPYTYSLLKNHLQHIKDFLSPSIFYCQQVLCSSLAGNKVPLVTITSKEIDEKEKVYVFLTARVHPGETNSSWIMKGILDFLTSNSEEACSLRSAVVFKIVPMLNPDGVINGCHRCSLSGQDLNRKWKQPDAVLHPSIYHTKSFLKYLASIDKKPEIFVDFHGHSRKKNIFMYGCRDVSLSESLSSLQLNSKCSNSMCHDIELLPKILSQETPCFSLSQCNFLVDKSKESTARVVCYSEIGIRKSYTMESTYCGMDQGTYKGHHIGTDRLERMGRDFCLALEKFFVLSDVI